ncbi:MAG: DUF4956 domain-containing protein [Saprospiraceae bacterium]
MKSFIKSILTALHLLGIQCQSEGLASAYAFTQVQSIENENLSTSKKSLEVSDVDNSEESTEKIATKRKQYIVDLDSIFYYSFLIDIAFVFIILFGIYYPTYRRTDTFFAFILFNVVIFILTYVLNQVKISMGAAFGLFAVFSMLRYRTLNIGMRDMTYLFICIAIGLVSGIQMEYDKLIILLTLLTVFIGVFDTGIFFKKEKTKRITIDNIELAHQAKKEELMEHLRTSTGYNIHHVATDNYDLKRKSVDVTIYYY